MKSLVKVAALLVVAMPLFAADMNTTTTTANGAVQTSKTVDCSQMNMNMQARCTADLKACDAMSDLAAKKVCMDKMTATYMSKNMPQQTDMTINKSQPQY